MTSLAEGCQNIELIIDLSLIFNETGYINKSDHGKYKQNNNVTHIILIQSDNSPIEIGDYFLYSYTKLISVDTSKIVNVISIGDYFLFDCNKLAIFDTTGLFTLITIGNDFLSNCEELTIFDATKLTSLTSIGNDFISYCHKLTLFDATKLRKITTIGYYFLYNCAKLTNFDATGLISLITIGVKFLYNCNKNLTITIKNPSNCLQEKLLDTYCKIIQLYDKPVIHLINDCVI